MRLARVAFAAMPRVPLLPRAIATVLLLLGLGSCKSAPAPLAIPDGENPLRWQKDIDALAAQPAPAPHPVVFVGSSSIRGWKTLQQDMAPIAVLNCGFGGSRIFDTTWHLDRVVTPFAPAAVVVFAGTNDIAGDEPRSAEWVETRFVELVARLRELGCDAPVVFLAITAAPSREQHIAIVRDANARIAARCTAMDGAHFVDASAAFFDSAGRPDPKWFVKDQLHLNADGYAEWARVVRPALERILAAR